MASFNVCSFSDLELIWFGCKAHHSRAVLTNAQGDSVIVGHMREVRIIGQSSGSGTVTSTLYDASRLCGASLLYMCPKVLMCQHLRSHPPLGSSSRVIVVTASCSSSDLLCFDIPLKNGNVVAEDQEI